MNTDQFLDALGGTFASAKIFGVVPSAVSNWRINGRLPDRLHLRAYRLAQERRLDYDPSDPNPVKSRGHSK